MFKPKDYPFILFGSDPLGPVVLRTLEMADCAPTLYISDKKLTLDEQLDLVEQYKISFILVAGYGRILKQALLDSVAGQVLNIHPSLLPEYRGPAPVVQTILDGATETGVTVIELDAQVDHGPVLAQENYPLRGNETPSELYEILGDRGARMFLDVIEDYLNDELDMLPQNHDDASFTHFVKKEDGLLLPEKESAVDMERKIRAYAGWPSAWLMHEEKRLIIHKAHIGSNGELVPTEVQPENGKRMSFEAYASGQRLKPAALAQALHLN